MNEAVCALFQVRLPASGIANWIGKSQSATDPYFNGRLDEVRFWNRALCATEIAYNKDCELYYPYIQSSLASYLSFDQNAAGGTNANDTLAYDGSRTAGNATLHNFALRGSGSNWVTGYLNNGTSCGYYAPAGLNDSTESVTQFVNSTTYFNACGEIAQVAPASGNPIAGNVTAKVTRYDTAHSYAGHAYVQRWYDITPAINAATATATVTLFFTQQEFDNYNAANGADPDLPTSSNDAAGVSHIRITQYHGTGTAPGNYTGSTVSITPTSAIYSDGRWAVTFPVTGFSGFTVAGFAATPLPVKLIAFNADAEVGGTVKLSWNVASQEGVAGYVVEKSTDGQHFTSAATLAVLAGSARYETTDLAPYTGRSYYRLRMIAGDGSASFSAMQSVLLQQSHEGISISPTPATTTVTIHLSDASLLNTVATISDMQGVVMKTVLIANNEQAISVEDFKPGIYLLHLANGGIAKIVKQ